MAVRPRCKHFTGVSSDRCEVGIEYAAVEKGRGSADFSLPCLPHRNPLGATCEKCELPTPEEIAAEEAESKLRVANMMAARKAIVEHLGGPWKRGTPGARGVIDCPVCNAAASLRFSRAGYNGHVHAACKTAGCVSWME